MAEPLEGIENELRLMRELHARYMRQSEEHIRGYRLMASRFARVVEENSEEIRRNREQSVKNIQAIEDLREATREHRAAILALLDRLNNGGPSPATG